MAQTIKFLVERGIPVMAHIGLTPQSSHTMGGFKTQGRIEDSWSGHEQDAQAVSDAGAFAIVLEGMVEPLAAKITQQIPIPTIGIGAGASCDGQVLVLHDMFGITQSFSPRFLRRYSDLGDQMFSAIRQYVTDVRAVDFPNDTEQY